jgi:catechol 2,3-dioxygenase
MTQPISITFSHVGIYVTDLNKMVDFYTRFLGFVVSDRGKFPGGAELAFLTRDANEHHQLVLATGRPADVSFNVVNQISFRVDSLRTLRQLHAALKNEPVTNLGTISHGNALSVYFLDPEGNRVELFIDTPWYVDQPLRIPLDMALPDAALWAKVEAEARKLPGFRPVEEWRATIAHKMRES